MEEKNYVQCFWLLKGFYNSRGRKREVAKVGSSTISVLVVGEWADGHPKHSLRREVSGGLPL